MSLSLPFGTTFPKLPLIKYLALECRIYLIHFGKREAVNRLIPKNLTLKLTHVTALSPF